VDAGLSDRPPDWNTNLLLLGDFDLDRLDTPLFQSVRVQRALAPAEIYTASKLKSSDKCRPPTAPSDVPPTSRLPSPVASSAGGEQGRQEPLRWTGDGTVPDCFTEAESDDTESEAIDMLDLLNGATRLFPIIGGPIRYVESPMRLMRTFGERGYNGMCVPMQVR
jgi:hypothetical protein